jgi:hypothetical protein
MKTLMPRKERSILCVNVLEEDTDILDDPDAQQICDFVSDIWNFVEKYDGRAIRGASVMSLVVFQNQKWRR